jgi:hypothetical protein
VIQRLIQQKELSPFGVDRYGRGAILVGCDSRNAKRAMILDH